jgi:hypothetical protein
MTTIKNLNNGLFGTLMLFVLVVVELKGLSVKIAGWRLFDLLRCCQFYSQSVKKDA